jgi:Phosphoribosylformylglycinamidine (FGAM) synthase, synthetase domain
MTRIGFAAEGQPILLVGGPEGWGMHLGQSIYLRDIHGRADGPPPPVDLAHEKKVGDFVRELIASGVVTACHDLSDGGLAVGLAEMAMASGIGATVQAPSGVDPIPVFFGEDQGRYVLTMSLDPQGGVLQDILKRAEQLGILMPVIGTTGGTSLKLGGTRAIPVAELKSVHEAWFPRFMGE